MPAQVVVGPHPLMAVVAVVVHVRAVNRIIFGQHDGSGVRPVFERATLAPEQVVEMFAGKGAEATPQHKLVAARDGADRIKLDTAKLPEDLEDGVGACFAMLWPVKPLGGNGQPPGCLWGKGTWGACCHVSSPPGFTEQNRLCVIVTGLEQMCN